MITILGGPAFGVAISSAGYDTHAVRLLVQRLHPRLRTGVGDRAGTPGERPREAPAPAEDVLHHAARLVIVLYDHLWGRTPTTATEREAIERRLAREGATFLRVLLLDDTTPPAWSRGVESCSLADTGIDASIEWLVAAVGARGGATRSAVEADEAARAAAAEEQARARDVYLGSHRALPACTREFDRLAADVTRRAAALAAERGNLKLEVRRAPGRCIVQLGPVALTLSWVRSRFDIVAEGRLLILEGQGVVARGVERVPERDADGRAGRQATAIREEVLAADATGQDDWRWRRESSTVVGYESRELAARCIDSLASALPGTPAH